MVGVHLTESYSFEMLRASAARGRHPWRCRSFAALRTTGFGLSAMQAPSFAHLSAAASRIAYSCAFRSALPSPAIP